MNEHVPGHAALPPITPTADSSLVSWTQVIYALHGFSLLTGILGAATVVGAFLTGWPSIIAVILNYVKRSDVRGTWLESHFRWQIRTFWFGLLWISLCVLFIVLTLGIGIIVAWLPIAIVGFWFIYRVVKGWLRFSTKSMPATKMLRSIPSFAWSTTATNQSPTWCRWRSRYRSG